ncbi:MAG: glycosyltransferase 87 family protein [Verrucomicrobiia bacterium]
MTRPLFFCLLVALVLRLGFIFVGFPRLQERWHLREDGDSYGAIAQTIREGHYDDITRGPVYPFFVAVAGSPLAMKVVQALLDTLTCALIFWLARLVIHAPRFRSDVPVWAAWLWALYPLAIWRIAFINKEIVLTFLLVAYVCVQLTAWCDDKTWRWLAAGALLGVVNLCKPTFLLLPLVVLVMRPRRGLLVLAAMLVVVVPWTARNWRVTGGEFLPVATEQGGSTTFVGNYQPTAGLWEGDGKTRWQGEIERIKQQNAGASVVALDRQFYHETWKQMTVNPLVAVELIVRKCGRFWFLGAARREQSVSIAIQAVWLALAMIGLWRCRPWGAAQTLMVVLVVYVMLVHALSYADLRFSLPVMPFVCAFAAAGICRFGIRRQTTVGADD